MARGGSVGGDVHTLRELFGSSFYLIDYYQREYEWSTGDVRTLVTDLVDAFRLDRPHGRHHRRREQGEQYFLGPFVFVQHNRHERFLVDGQQRFTTLHLLFLHLYRQAVVRDDNATADRLRRVIHEEWDGPHPRFRIRIDERREALEAIFFDRGYAPGPDSTLSVRTLWQRACELAELLDEFLEEDDGAEFADWLLSRVVLVGIQAPSRDSGLRIFESMNDRGARLTPVDLLKSFLLSGIGDDGREKLNERWRSMLAALTVTRDDTDAPRVFLKAALIAHYAEFDDSSRDLQEIDGGLHLWVKRHRERLDLVGEDHFHEFVENLLDLAKHHRTLLAATLRPHRADGLAAVFFNAVNGLDHQLVLMLAAIRPHDTAVAVKSKAGLVAAYLDRCFVEQVLRDQPVGRDEQDEDIRELVPLLKRCTTADDVARLLRDRLTGGDFAEVLTFGRRGNNRANVQYLLARLTDHVERGCGGADRVEEYLSAERTFQIEHLFANHPERLAHELPDAADFRALRERLGALVLLPASENASYGDKPLPEKLPLYARQNHLAAVLCPVHSTNNPTLRRFGPPHLSQSRQLDTPEPRRLRSRCGTHLPEDPSTPIGRPSASFRIFRHIPTKLDNPTSYDPRGLALRSRGQHRPPPVPVRRSAGPAGCVSREATLTVRCTTKRRLAFERALIPSVPSMEVAEPRMSEPEPDWAAEPRSIADVSEATGLSAHLA